MSDNRNDKQAISEPAAEVNIEKRKFLMATSALGALGCAAAAVPFIKSMTPSERAKAAGAPVEVDISKIAPGTMMTAEWRGKPVWIINRTDEMISTLALHNDQLSDPNSQVSSQQPEYCNNASRAIKPNLAVLVGICTHLGCSPSAKLDKANSDMGVNWSGGFFCPCHGSKFDLAGRVFRGSPAPINLVVPPYKYLADNTLLIGVDTEEKA